MTTIPLAGRNNLSALAHLIGELAKSPHAVRAAAGMGSCSGSNA